MYYTLTLTLPPLPPRPALPPPHPCTHTHTPFKFSSDTAHDHRTRDGASVIVAFLSKFHFYNLSVNSLFKRHKNNSETVNDEKNNEKVG